MDSEAADNILPLPGSQGSLSQNKDIILDGVYPTIISITPRWKYFAVRNISYN